MDWTDEAAEALNRITANPMTGAVRGTVEVIAISEPVGRARYQEAHVELRTQAPGRPSVVVQTDVVLDRKNWPLVGTVLPAHIPAGDPPAQISIDWQSLT